MFVSAIYVLAFAVSVYVIYRQNRFYKAESSGNLALRFKKSGMIWACVWCAVEAFIVVWAAMGLVQNDIVSAFITGIILTICTYASVARPRIARLIDSLVNPAGVFPHPVVMSVILILCAGIFTTLALEIPSNHVIWTMYPLCLLLEFSLITAVLAGLFFVFQRHSVISSIFTLAMLVLGIAEYFVVTFKNQPIQPGDLTALSTAAAVAGTGYVYNLTCYCLYGIVCAAVAVVLLQAAGAILPTVQQRNLIGGKAVVCNVIVGLICLAGVTAHVTLIDYYNLLGISVYSWRPLDSYYEQGYLPTFISSAQTIRPPRPQNYSVSAAENLEKDYANEYDTDPKEGASTSRIEAETQFDSEKPTVIGIMNETFSDLSIYQNLHSDYEGPQFFKSISDALSRGKLYVSAYGGGTANTEFEFLTGNSMSFLGQGVYPYTLYNLTETSNLARQFDALGYDTTAMHPNHATNWNRENVYRDLGFDNFLTIEDFQGSETLRNMVTDEATYDKILELLETNQNPQFIFDVTMQNHSGYNTNLMPVSMRTHYCPDGMYDPELNEYLALIQESDRALEEFLDHLRSLDRKVIVVFFGDHQPFFGDDYNDNWFTNEDQAEHAERMWQTSYVIWANYDVTGNSQTSEERDISANYLGALLMELIGAPLTDYQKAQLEVMQTMPAINTTGYESADGTWYLTGEGPAADFEAAEGGSPDPDDGDVAEAHYNLSLMQYYELFGDGKNIYTLHQQSSANQVNPTIDPDTRQ